MFYTAMYKISDNALASRLIPWYKANARNLPWRADTVPYHVWVSEIMLQQTRVEAVKDYYLRFMHTLPDIKALAQCDDEVLLKLWEGLGYYSRARNLKRAAQQIETQFGGIFPQDYKTVLSLPGIGPYTAGAVCSVCFNLATPAIDGNVLRVLSRILCYSDEVTAPHAKKFFTEFLQCRYPKTERGTFTQALMELGATVCVPNGPPKCDICPLCDICRGYKTATQRQYPVLPPKKERKKENLSVFLLNANGRYAIKKRPSSGLLANLWEFPNISETMNEQQAAEYVKKLGVHPRELLLKRHRTHIFTHIEWHMTAFVFHCSSPTDDFIWATEEDLHANYSLPTAFRKCWETNKRET